MERHRGRRNRSGWGLTTRHVQLLDLLVQRYTYAEIAQRLGISKSTYYDCLTDIETLLGEYDWDLTKTAGHNRTRRIRELWEQHREAVLLRWTQLAGTFPGPEPPHDRDPFVGRNGELDRLLQALDSAHRGRPVVALVSGEGGIGKSALCARLADAARSLGGTVLWGYCTANGRRTQPYEALAGAVRSYVRLQPVGRLRRKLDFDPGYVDALAGLVPELRPHPQGPAGAIDLPPQTRERYLHNGLVTLFGRIAKDAPLVILLEDLHWGDRGTLQFLGVLAQAMRTTLAGTRLLVAGTYRADEPTSLPDLDAITLSIAGAEGSMQIALSGLAPDEVASLFRLAGGPDAGSEKVAVVHRQTGGNPLFVRELARYLSDGGSWRDAPLTVRDVIRGRLSGLDEGCQRALQLGAVFGETFDLETIEALGGGAPEELYAALQEAVQRQVLGVEEGPFTALRYRFNHGFTRQVLYEAVAHPRRAELHLRAAALLEQRYDGSVVQHAHDIAQHYYHTSEAGAPLKVLYYGLTAGERAASLHAHDQALHWFDLAGDALDAMEDDTSGPELSGFDWGNGPGPPALAPPNLGDLRLRLLAGRAATELASGNLFAAEESLWEALKRCDPERPGERSRVPSEARNQIGATRADTSLTTGTRLDDQSRRAWAPHLCYQLARVEEGLGRFDGALATVARGLDACGVSPSAFDQPFTGAPIEAPPVAIRLLVWGGFVELRRANYGAAEIWARRALSAADTGLDGGPALRQAEAQARNLAGVLCRLRGMPAEAETHHRASISLYEAAGDPVGQELAHTNLAVALRDLGDLGGAMEHLDRSRALAQHTGDPIRLAAASINAAEILTALGDAEAARLGCEHAAERMEQAGQRNFAAIARMNLADAHLALGDAPAALAAASAALDGFVHLGAGTYQAEAHRHRALALVALGQNQEGLEAAELAVAQARSLGRRVEVARGLRVLGQVHIAFGGAGHLPAGERALIESEAIFEAAGCRYELGLTLIERCRLLSIASPDEVAGGPTRWVRALQYGEAALDLLQRAGALPSVKRAETLLRSLRERTGVVGVPAGPP